VQPHTNGCPNSNRLLALIRTHCQCRHSGGSRNPVFKSFWTPAFAGVTTFGYVNDFCD
jgi:hypothetical protein